MLHACHAILPLMKMAKKELGKLTFLNNKLILFLNLNLSPFTKLWATGYHTSTRDWYTTGKSGKSIGDFCVVAPSKHLTSLFLASFNLVQQKCTMLAISVINSFQFENEKQTARLKTVTYDQIVMQVPSQKRDKVKMQD